MTDTEQTAPQQTATVQMPRIPTAELAKCALEFLAKAQVVADESTLIVAIQVRSLLSGIASGALVVGKPMPPPQPESDKPA